MTHKFSDDSSCSSESSDLNSSKHQYSFPGLLLYFLYGIHHSKLGEDTTGLLSGNGNNGWGAVEKTSAIARRVGRFTRGSKGEDRKPIISDDDLARP